MTVNVFEGARRVIRVVAVLNRKRGRPPGPRYNTDSDSSGARLFIRRGFLDHGACRVNMTDRIGSMVIACSYFLVGTSGGE
jgi:hypothetical protein